MLRFFKSYYVDFFCERLFTMRFQCGSLGVVPRITKESDYALVL
jgi:hypothetical protein